MIAFALLAYATEYTQQHTGLNEKKLEVLPSRLHSRGVHSTSLSSQKPRTRSSAAKWSGAGASTSITLSGQGRLCLETLSRAAQRPAAFVGLTILMDLAWSMSRPLTSVRTAAGIRPASALCAAPRVRPWRRSPTTGAPAPAQWMRTWCLRPTHVDAPHNTSSTVLTAEQLG